MAVYKIRTSGDRITMTNLYNNVILAKYVKSHSAVRIIHFVAFSSKYINLIHKIHILNVFLKFKFYVFYLRIYKNRHVCEFMHFRHTTVLVLVPYYAELVASWRCSSPNCMRTGICM